MVGAKWAKDKDGDMVAEGGKWLEVKYSRPSLRGRTNIFGTGADYGKTVAGDKRLWRAGANATTTFKTEVPLMIGGKRIEPGTYGVLVELKEPAWTLILSSQPRAEKYDDPDKTKLFATLELRPQVRRRARADDDDDAEGVDRSVHDRLRGHVRRRRQARDGLGQDGGARSVHGRAVGSDVCA